jgi:hypothetical protein
MKLDASRYNLLFDALTDAFDLRGLKNMLRAELGKDLDDIVLPENRKDAIAELIAAAERGHWERDLLIAARASQPGNKKLRNAADGLLFGAQALLPDLLVILRKASSSPDTSITEACYKQSWPEGWEPSPRQYDSGISIRNYAYELAAYEHCDDRTFPLLDFVGRLCSNAKMKAVDLARLKKWLETARQRLKPRTIRKRMTSGELGKTMFVLVSVVPRELKPGYHGVQAWLLRARDKPSLFPEELEVKAEEIEPLMDRIRERLTRPPFNVNLGHVRIEVFLPRNLMQLPIDDWKVRPVPVDGPGGEAPGVLPGGLKLPSARPLGQQHQVVIRSSERLLYRALLDPLLDRWPDQLLEDASFTVIGLDETLAPDAATPIAVLLGTPAAGGPEPDYFDLFSSNPVLCCLFGIPPPDASVSAPGPDPLSDLIAAGIPMALWTRGLFPEEELKIKLRELISEHSFCQVPQAVHELRSKPKCPATLRDLRRAVTLFFDDPNRLPPVCEQGSRLVAAEEGD